MHYTFYTKIIQTHTRHKARAFNKQIMSRNAAAALTFGY